jgi:hypothetical protein
MCRAEAGQVGLLAYAIDNIHPLVSHKMALIASGQSDLVPNCNINQTLCRITCPDVQTFIGGATVEYSNLQRSRFAMD